MKRSSERIIDAFVLVSLLSFAYLMREVSPELAGVIVGHAGNFWLTKNANAPHESIEQAAALAAAEVLRVARAERKPSEVEVVNTDAAPVPIIQTKK